MRRTGPRADRVRDRRGGTGRRPEPNHVERVHQRRHQHLRPLEQDAAPGVHQAVPAVSGKLRSDAPRRRVARGARQDPGRKAGSQADRCGPVGNRPDIRHAGRAQRPLGQADDPIDPEPEPRPDRQTPGHGLLQHALSRLLGGDRLQHGVREDAAETLDDLLAWIKANPGKFTYCDPNTGGSGQAFMVAVVYKFAPMAQYTGGAPYDPAKEAAWDPAWQMLKSLEPAMYNNGFHPNGNVAVLQLLAQQNVYIAPVWSDMGTDYLKRGLLPKTVKLEQITPPLFGGDSTVTAPAGSTHLEGTFTLLNWLLTSEAQQMVITAVSGYPGVDWKYMPAGVRQQFADVAKPYAPLPDSKYFADMKRLWHERVAGGG